MIGEYMRIRAYVIIVRQNFVTIFVLDNQTFLVEWKVAKFDTPWSCPFVEVFTSLACIKAWRVRGGRRRKIWDLCKRNLITRHERFVKNWQKRSKSQLIEPRRRQPWQKQVQLIDRNSSERLLVFWVRHKRGRNVNLGRKSSLNCLEKAQTSEKLRITQHQSVVCTALNNDRMCTTRLFFSLTAFLSDSFLEGA